jgi:hypothetical protein
VISLLDRNWRYDTPIDNEIAYATIGSGGKRFPAHSVATMEWMRIAARPWRIEENLVLVSGVEERVERWERIATLW